MHHILRSLLGPRAYCGRRSTAKPVKSWIPMSGCGVNITDKDPCLEAVHDWFDEGYTSHNDAQVGLNRGCKDCCEIVERVIRRSRS